MKNFTHYLCLFLLSICTINAQDLPSTADPGKCYVKCIITDEFKEVVETVEVQPAYETLKVIPGTYKTVNERVLVKEASKKYVYVPATYETIDVTLQNEALEELSVIPAKFSPTSKSIEVKPVTSGWEYKTLEDCISANKEDCVAACYVEHPAVNRTIAQQKLIEPAKTIKSEKTGTFNTYKKQVIKTPARYIEEEIPAVYKTVKKQVIDIPSRVVSTTVPVKQKTSQKLYLSKKVVLQNGKK